MNINISGIKKSTPIQRLKNFFNKGVVVSFIAKTIAITLIWIGALIPIWLYLITRWLTSPEGFWQELAIIIIAAVLVGWLQVILIILALALTFTLIAEDI